MEDLHRPVEPDAADDDEAEPLFGADLLLAIISAIPRISREREHELARRAAEGDPRARRDLIFFGLPQVASLALKYRRRGGVTLDDLLAAALFGLCRAVDRFDPERGTRLSTYAGYWIRKYVYLAFKDPKKQAKRETPLVLLGDSRVRRLIEDEQLRDDDDDEDDEPRSDRHDRVDSRVFAGRKFWTILETLWASPAEQREAYVLDTWWELPQREIADTLGVSVKTIYLWCQAERARIEAALEDAA